MKKENNRIGKTPKCNLDFMIGIAIMIVAIILFIMNELNAVQYQLLTYDESYNATVAANVARYGEYRVSYPSKSVFYNMITTGETMLLPTALVYKLFGINTITSSIIPLVYGVLSIGALWKLLLSCMEKDKRKVYTITALLICFLLLSNDLYSYISRKLLGEVAALFFLTISFIALYQYLEKQKVKYLIISGAMLAFSFLTKSSMIFFVVSCFGMIFLEIFIAKTIKRKDALGYYIGFIIGFGILDTYKFLQLGGLSEYLNWWKAEWANMLNQSSGVDITYSISDKINYLEHIFYGCNKYFCLVMLIVPVVGYIVHLFLRIRKKNEIVDNGMLVMSISGVAGASLIIYFILLGGSGLVNSRRLIVNSLFVRLFVVYIIGGMIFQVIERISRRREDEEGWIGKSIFLIAVILGTVVFAFPNSVLKNNLVAYMNKKSDYEYNVELMNGFLKEIKELPHDSDLYCVGWWQEPNVTLFLDKEMKDIYQVKEPNTEFNNNSYLIVGNLIHETNISDIEDMFNINLIRIDKSEVDYNNYSIPFDRRDFDLFAIYKIRLKDNPIYNLGTEVHFSNSDNSDAKYIKYSGSVANN